MLWSFPMGSKTDFELDPIARRGPMAIVRCSAMSNLPYPVSHNVQNKRIRKVKNLILGRHFDNRFGCR